MSPSFIEVDQFTIVRSEWSRGKGKDTCILNEMRERDCIGFFLKACGATDAQLLRLDEPIDVIIKYGWESKLVEGCGEVLFQTVICRAIISVNDNPILKDQERERQLISLFRQMNVNLNFID